MTALFFLFAAVVICAAEITLQVWKYAMPGEEEYCRRLIADFERANPGDKVNFQFASWEGAHEKMMEWLQTGTGADLMVVCDMWICEFAPYLRPYVDDLTPAHKSEYFDVLLNKATYQGHTYGLVWAATTKVLYYRTDLLHEAHLGVPASELPPLPPRTWDEVREWGGLLQDSFSASGPYALGIPVKLTYESTCNWYFFFWTAGGEFFDESGKSSVNSPLGVAALTYYRDLARVHKITQPEVTSWSRKDLEKFFAHGQLAMHANGPCLVGEIAELNPALPYAIAPLPVAPNQPPFQPRHTTQVITDHLMLSRGCQEPELAQRFIEFAYQDKYRQEFCELGMLPEKKAVADSDFFQGNPLWKTFVDILPGGKFLPLMNWEPIELATQQMIWKVFSGRQEPQEALDELAAVMDRVAAEQA